MKTFKFICSILLLLISREATSQVQWTWLNPLPQGNDLYNMQFINSSTGFIAGDGGSLMKTVNSGMNWIGINTGTATLLRGLSVINQNVIYASGENRVLKTMDGGQNWTIFNFNNAYFLNTTFFINENSGYVNGTLLLRTSNGGMNWDSLYTGFDITSLYFQNFDTGFATQGSVATIYRTRDAGASWYRVFEVPNNNAANCISFVNSNTGFGLCAAGKICKTTDGGDDWFILPSVTTTALLSISFTDTNNILVGGRSGFVMKSS